MAIHDDKEVTVSHVVEVEDLTVDFGAGERAVRAVDHVSFRLDRGEVLAIVGESGSGKSVTAMSLLGLNPTPPARYVEGSVRIEGDDVLRMSESRLRGLRGNRVAIIFQDPMSSLNPVFTIGDQLREAVRAHSVVSRKVADERALEAMKAVGIPSPERRLRQYPHEFSGGMLQRVMIAMALVTEAQVLVADEPTTALDVTIQAQILELLLELREEKGVSIIIVTHDLGVVAKVADQVLVMYAGRVMERGSVRQVLKAPGTPYTAGLLGSLPELGGPRQHRLPAIAGKPPDLSDLPPGCRFQQRCPQAREECGALQPPVVRRAEGHEASCVLSDEEMRLAFAQVATGARAGAGGAP